MNSSTGTVTGVAAGTAVITGKWSYNSSKTVTYTVNVTEIPSGTYFIQNRETEKYVQPDNDDAPNYSNNGGIMEQMDFDGGDYQRWIFTHTGDGYYKITSKKSGYAITVPAGKESTSDIDLILTPYTGSNNQKWKITKTHNGSYKIKAKSSESYTAKDLVLDVQSYIITQNLNIQQREYLDNDSYGDEWWLVGPLFKYSFGMSIQNAYTNNCEMKESGNYVSFGVYADNLKEQLQKGMNLKFDYRGVNSWSTDFKNKSLPSSTHTYTNMDDVDLMIYTGHGYAKNRNKDEGLFQYNSLHFGTTDSTNAHPLGQGTIASANFTTQDALYMGYGNAITKWMIAYTCNFLNTAQGDPNVLNMLDNGGRLILGAASKSYIVGEEGYWLGLYLLQGMTFKDAYFQAAQKAQGPSLNGCGVRYSILYYGPENAGTLNDKITEPVKEVEKTGGKTITQDVNAYLGINCS